MEFILVITIIVAAYLTLRKKKKTHINPPVNKSVVKTNNLESDWNRWVSTFDPENCSEIQRTFKTKVVGVTYSNKDGSNRQSIISKCRIGEKLLLIPVEYKGDWAIAVCRNNFEQLGHLNADLAPEISDLIVRRKSRVDAKISSFTGGKGKTEGVNIEIIKYVVKNRPKKLQKEKVEEKPYDPSIKMHRLSYQRNIQAAELESKGYIDNAIELYRSIVENNRLEMNDTVMPFYRLAVIYRKRRDYDNEIEIINKWKEMYLNSEMDEDSKKQELESLEKRLNKAKSLKERKK